MKTRDQLYGERAADVFRCITSYHCIKKDQLARIFPEKAPQFDNLLGYLLRQERIFHSPDNADIFFDSPEMEVDRDMLSAIYVLCDFAERAEYHSAGEYPVKLLFFAEEEMYEVIVVPNGKETLMNCTVTEQNEDGKRLVVVEDILQADCIDIPNVAAFCTVDLKSGQVEYYTLEE